MKKGIILIVLSFATLLSAFFVSGTYAKYTNTYSGSSSAKVAKWEFGLKKTIDLLDIIYDTQGEDFEYPGPQYTAKDEDVSDGKLAPGTYGTYQFEISGTSETSYRLQFDFSGSVDNTGGRLDYCLDTTCYDTLKELEEAINYNYTTNTFKPGQQPGYYKDGNGPLVHTISVIWKYDCVDLNGNVCDKEAKELFDKADTELGIKAANGEKLEVKLVVEVEAIQID